ncbi:MAG: hypothetical protein ACT4OZ_02155 [Gemmatimonadota bacterium]
MSEVSGYLVASYVTFWVAIGVYFGRLVAARRAALRRARAETSQ